MRAPRTPSSSPCTRSVNRMVRTCDTCSVALGQGSSIHRPPPSAENRSSPSGQRRAGLSSHPYGASRRSSTRTTPTPSRPVPDCSLPGTFHISPSSIVWARVRRSPSASWHSSHASASELETSDAGTPAGQGWAISVGRPMRRSRRTWGLSPAGTDQRMSGRVVSRLTDSSVPVCAQVRPRSVLRMVLGRQRASRPDATKPAGPADSARTTSRGSSSRVTPFVSTRTRPLPTGRSPRRHRPWPDHSHTSRPRAADTPESAASATTAVLCGREASATAPAASAIATTAVVSKSRSVRRVRGARRSIPILCPHGGPEGFGTGTPHLEQITERSPEWRGQS